MSGFQAFRLFLKEHIFNRFTSKVALILVVVLCTVSLAYHYFIREDAVSPLMIAGAVVVPFQEGVNQIGGFLYQTEQDRLTLQEAKDRIKDLESENAALKRQVEDLNSLSIENEELRGLLLARERYSDYEMQEALVIGNDGVNCFERFTINKGSADGIKENMNVINNDGLVGIVTKVGLNYSIVTSIIEDGMNVSAMTRNTHENCIVSGNMSLSGESTLVLDNALADIDFETNAALVTSNISDKYLPNLLIGYVKETQPNTGGLTQSGLVTTVVDFTDIREVLVITTELEELVDEEAKK